MGHECKCCFHHSRHLIYATKLNIMKSLGISQYLSNGGGGVGDLRILVRITWFSREIDGGSLRLAVATEYKGKL